MPGPLSLGSMVGAQMAGEGKEQEKEEGTALGAPAYKSRLSQRSRWAGHDCGSQVGKVGRREALRAPDLQGCGRSSRWYGE